ncbi:hypothetical protein E4U27_008244 [Claviceps purpurea]|nr:hypothetical protein E4U27_008244 [Claviceps purpurea]
MDNDSVTLDTNGHVKTSRDEADSRPGKNRRTLSSFVRVEWRDLASSTVAPSLMVTSQRRHVDHPT